ncbi:ribonuclease P protein subunit [Dipodascopsis tothii]|uniref:ribonuclease P protein subunit n=1 Tax=Dipodascopsis tothii TaxID=44089 RepID=UPI0034CD82D7
MVSLIASAAPSTDALALYADRVEHKPLALGPTEQNTDAAAGATSRREAKYLRLLQIVHPRDRRPLSAKQKKLLRLHQLPATPADMAAFLPLHRLWQAYVHELLSLTAANTARRPSTAGQLQNLASRLTSADLHGAYVRIVRCRCVSRVGLRGIVVKESRSAFTIAVDGQPRLQIVPKAYTVFKVGVTRPHSTAPPETLDTAYAFEFYIYGTQLLYRPTDRSGRKFKSKVVSDL